MGDESKLFYEKLSRSPSRYFESIRLFRSIINTRVVINRYKYRCDTTLQL